MSDLDKYREQIDETDAAIVKLFEKRMKLVENVADYK
ncbi:MAG: chorismate mutase, partial [Eubacterium sp.]|nr:chorismate mutase [Eubacterium sp.]